MNAQDTRAAGAVSAQLGERRRVGIRMAGDVFQESHRTGVFANLRNIHARLRTSAKLAKHQYGAIRENVARHPNADATTLTYLSRDRSQPLWYLVAFNPNTPTRSSARLRDRLKPWAKIRSRDNSSLTTSETFSCQTGAQDMVSSSMKFLLDRSSARCPISCRIVAKPAARIRCLPAELRHLRACNGAMRLSYLP